MFGQDMAEEKRFILLGVLTSGSKADQGDWGGVPCQAFWPCFSVGCSVCRLLSQHGWQHQWPPHHLAQ